MADNEVISNEHLNERKSSRRRRKRKGSIANSSTAIQEEHPNAFICFRIQDRELINALSAAQDEIREKHDELKNTFIEPSTFHVTLAVLRLTEKSEINMTIDLLRETCALFSPFSLEFHGLSCFSNRVIYANAVEDDVHQHLSRLQEDLINRLMTSNLTLFNHEEFRAHATILKLSKDKKLRKIGYRSIPDKVYADYASRHFGRETVDELLVCRMLMDDAKQDRFYQLIGKASLPSQNSSNLLDHPLYINGTEFTLASNSEEDSSRTPTGSALDTHQEHRSKCECEVGSLIVNESKDDCSGEVPSVNIYECTNCGVTNGSSLENGKLAHQPIVSSSAPPFDDSTKEENSNELLETNPVINGFHSEQSNASADGVDGSSIHAVDSGRKIDAVDGSAEALKASGSSKTDDHLGNQSSPIAVQVHSTDAAKPERKKKRWTVRRLLSRLVACTKVQTRAE